MAKSNLNRGSLERSGAPVSAEKVSELESLDSSNTVLVSAPDGVPDPVVELKPTAAPKPVVAPKPAPPAPKVYQVGDEYLLDGKKGIVIVVLKDTFKVRWPDKTVSFVKK